MLLLVPALVAAQPAASPGAAQAAVEAGLLPAVMLAGGPAVSWPIEDRMRRYNTPGLGIAVIHEGGIDWVGAYGVAQAGGSDSITTSTLFQAASISKLVTATMALRLVEDGRLDLDADVNALLSSWSLPPSEHTERTPVTLRRLLSHTAGVTVAGFPGYPRNAELPTRLQVLQGSGPANSPPIRVDELPGSRYRYSGGGYQIIQILIEDVARTELEELAQTSVFQPLGMKRTTFRTLLPPPLGRQAADGHRYDGRTVEGGSYLYPEQAAAALWSTPSDLAQLTLALMRAFKGRDNLVMNQQTAEAMLTPVLPGIGLGPGVHGTGESMHFDHAGWTQGFRAYVVAFPMLESGLVVMANGDGADDLINEIVRSVSRTYEWPDFKPSVRAAAPVSAGTLETYSGEFQVAEGGFTLAIDSARDHLVVRTPRGSYYTFYPSSEDHFFCIEDGSTLTVSQAQDGELELRLWGTVARPTG